MIVSKLVTRMTSLRLFKIDNRFFCLQVHNSASKGFTKEGAQLYESGRPSYTDESIEKIINIAKLKFSNSNIVLELGAGTGKFTSSFLALSKKYNILPNMRYIATEPSDGFRKRIEDKYSNSDYSGSLEVMKGLGSCIPAVSKSLDCVIAAQAFHWMATESTVIEMHRVLKPRAPVVLIWNTYDYDSNKWMKQIDDEILSPAYRSSGAPRQQDRLWSNCFQSTKGLDTDAASSLSPSGGLFELPIQFWYGKQPHSMSREGVMARVLSTSVIFEKSPEEKHEITRQLAAILDTHPDLRLSREKGIYTVDYITEIAWTRAIEQKTGG